MDGTGAPRATELSEKGALLARRWLECVAEAYPENTSLRLQKEGDRFRNPAGYALREGLSVLVEEILGGMNVDRIMPALDGIVRIRAVQDFTAGQAVSFVFLLRGLAKEHLRDEVEVLATVERRIDEVALLAFDLFMRCREKIYDLRANELRRSMYVQTRREMKGTDLEEHGR